MSAVLVVVSASVYLYERVLSTGLFAVDLLVVTTAVGLVLFVPVVAGAQRMATKFDE